MLSSNKDKAVKILFVIILLTATVCRAQTREAKVSKAAEALHEKLVQLRRDFHMHPELSNREARTAKVIAEKLRALGLGL